MGTRGMQARRHFVMLIAWAVLATGTAWLAHAASPTEDAAGVAAAGGDAHTIPVLATGEHKEPTSLLPVQGPALSAALVTLDSLRGEEPLFSVTPPVLSQTLQAQRVRWQI